MIRKLISRLLPSHIWRCNDSGEFRECSVCGRTEELDCGGGFVGSAWLTVSKGNRNAHMVRAAERNQSPQLNAEQDDMPEHAL